MENLEEYKKLTSDFISRIYKVKILSEFSFNSFNEFPNRIHKEAKYSWEKSIDYTIRERESFASGSEIEVRDSEVIEGDRISIPYIHLQRIHNNESQKIVTSIGGQQTTVCKIDFEQLVLDQNLVYLIGLIEGFMLESVILIYKNKSELLSEHDLQVDFKTLNEMNDIQTLRNHMIDQAIGRTWSERGFSTRIEKLRTKFNIILGFKKDLIKLLDEANLIRNCVLHNGSKVSKEYEEGFATKRLLKKNDSIKFSKYFLDAIYYLSLDFVKSLFINTSGCVWGDGEKINSEIYISGIHPNYFKDVMLTKGNWINTEMLDNNVL